MTAIVLRTVEKRTSEILTNIEGMDAQQSVSLEELDDANKHHDHSN